MTTATDGPTPHLVEAGQPEAEAPPSSDTGSEAKERRRRRLLAALALLVLAAIAVFGYLLWVRDDHDNTLAGVIGLRAGVPTIVSLSQLESVAAEKGPIYWAGPRPGSQYEITVGTDADAFVRYLPKGVSAGSTHDYLTIGTYTSIDGYDALAAAKMRGAAVQTSPTGALIVTFRSAPDSTYFAFPRSAFQVEVFSPVAGQSRHLTDAGDITLVPSH